MKNPYSSVFLFLGFLLAALLFAPYSYAVTCGDPGDSYTDSGDGTPSQIGGVASAQYSCSKFTNPFTYTAVTINSTTTIQYSQECVGTAADAVCDGEGYTKYCKTGFYYYDAPDETCEDPESEPDTCSNGSHDPTEEGIDCGGNCSAPCVFRCPYGTEKVTDSVTGQEYCVDTVPKNNGDCPPGYVDLGDFCAYMTDPVAAPSDGSSPQDDVVADDGWTPVDTQPFYDDNPDDTSGDPGVDVANGDFTTYDFKTKSDTTTETTDNGDGTSTTKTTTTTTDSGGGTTTTVKIEIFDNDTGKPVGTTTTTTEEKDTSEATFAYDYGEAQEYDGELSSDDLPEKTDMSEVIGQVYTLPVMSVLSSYQVSLSNTECSFDVGTVWGTDISIDMCRYDSTLRQIGAVLLVAVQGLAIFIAIFGWKGGNH